MENPSCRDNTFCEGKKRKDGESELLLLAEAVRRTKARRDETNETKRTHYIEENNFHSEHWVRRDEAGDAKRRGK